MAEIIDGKALRNRILEGLKAEVKKLEKKPFLAVIIVGNDPASKIYVSNKKKTALELGFQSVVIEMPQNTPEKVLLEKIEELNKNKEVNAILVQLPLPAHISTERVLTVFIRSIRAKSPRMRVRLFIRARRKGLSGF